MVGQKLKYVLCDAASSLFLNPVGNVGFDLENCKRPGTWV